MHALAPTTCRISCMRSFVQNLSSLIDSHGMTKTQPQQPFVVQTSLIFASCCCLACIRCNAFWQCQLPPMMLM